LPYKDLFGGVSAMTKQDFKKVNGFSNRFWGWGGEDDDMRRRIGKANLTMIRYSPQVARYVNKSQLFVYSRLTGMLSKAQNNTSCLFRV
jgi:predicted glycosyltransferase involved in capsule biosynthesis